MFAPFLLNDLAAKTAKRIAKFGVSWTCPLSGCSSKRGQGIIRAQGINANGLSVVVHCLVPSFEKLILPHPPYIGQTHAMG
jgi:hypothetical protein